MTAYDLRVYQVAAGELETLARIFRELALPMMPDHGIRAVGFWTDPAANRLYQVSQHDRPETIQSNWDRFHADPPGWSSTAASARLCRGSKPTTWPVSRPRGVHAGGAVCSPTISQAWHPRFDADPVHRWLRQCAKATCVPPKRKVSQ